MKLYKVPVTFRGEDYILVASESIAGVKRIISDQRQDIADSFSRESEDMKLGKPVVLTHPEQAPDYAGNDLCWDAGRFSELTAGRAFFHEELREAREKLEAAEGDEELEKAYSLLFELEKKYEKKFDAMKRRKNREGS